MLAILAMLARNSALVRGCGWLRSSQFPPLRAVAWGSQVGTGKRARRSNRKADLGRYAKGAGARVID